MENQIELLNALADELESQPKDKAKSLSILVSAGIITPEGNFTRPYSNLEAPDCNFLPPST